MTIPLIGITSNEKPVRVLRASLMPHLLVFSGIQSSFWAISNQQTKDSLIILLRVLNKVLGLYIGATFEIEKEDVPKEKYSFDHLVYT